MVSLKPRGIIVSLSESLKPSRGKLLTNSAQVMEDRRKMAQQRVASKDLSAVPRTLIG